jgi:hypothetical protein
MQQWLISYLEGYVENLLEFHLGIMEGNGILSRHINK